MDCQRAQYLLSLWLERDLSANEETAQMEVHVAGCEHCVAAKRQLQASQSALQLLAADEPLSPARPSLWPSLAGRLQPVSVAPALRQGLHWPTLVASAACVLMVAATGTQVWWQSQQPRPNLFVTQPVTSQTSPVVAPHPAAGGVKLARPEVRPAGSTPSGR